MPAKAFSNNLTLRMLLAAWYADQTGLCTSSGDQLQHGRMRRFPAHCTGPNRTDQIDTLVSLRKMSFADIIALTKDLTDADREHIRRGWACNRAIVHEGLRMLSEQQTRPDWGLSESLQTTITRHVTAGVYARMSGCNSAVYALCGSGNKGICTSVPVAMQAHHMHLPQVYSILLCCHF